MNTKLIQHNIMQEKKIDFLENSPFHLKVHSIKRSSVHWHDNTLQIVLPLKGSVKVTSGYERLNVEEGDFVFLNHKYIHSISSSSDAIVASIYINLDYFEDQFPYIKYMFFRSNTFADEGFEIESTNFEENIRREYKIRFRNVLINLVSDYINTNPTPELTIKKYEQQLIYALVYEFDWLQFIKKNDGFVSSVQLDRYHRILRYIDQNYDQKITLEDIVAEEFITKNYFSHFWKKVNSYSFQERINYERVIKSELFLLSNMSISDISDRCGFSDVKYYYRSFKRWHGCMPLEHKAKYHEYIQKGIDFKEIDFKDVKGVFYNYVNNYFMISCHYDKQQDILSSVENYLKIRYTYALAKYIDTDAPINIAINPFSSNNFHIDEEDIFFNWHNMDLWVNLTIDLEFELQILMKTDHMDESTFYSIMSKFIDHSIYRYGIKIVKKWTFINNGDSASYQDPMLIDNLIKEKIKNAKIKYVLEL
ncbi:AraC-like DNA-binding protein [Alkalibaculum bacchi]|uniref:AraC-like DNA-binding protein n=1 Tax=Alkalibaculum bacchi TaxID=645887 RepID=A0A366IAS6_9FIRM|nr:helix-turn-helix domain-containing protein [Alkalibaculum bacchi]RBP65963.1 AraC-like DNA-binding protein [Alkalibaculum bacchi]